MPKAVKTSRAYDSSRRREQAAATRDDIVAAALRLFELDGYAATTIAAVAREAGVATKTVYLGFETKAGLLRAAWNHTLRAEDPDRPMGQHPGYLEALEAAEPERQLRVNARNSRLGKLRIGALAAVIREAAPLDPEIAALWERINSEYHGNQRAIVERIAAKKALRRGLDVDRATDILWTINHPDTWQLLVGRRGWTPEDYERWAGDTACEQLLVSRRSSGARRSA
jgi:AcrR family transcriptional regulator